MFKGVDFFPHGTKIPVMEWRRFCVSLSLIATVLAIALLSRQHFTDCHGARHRFAVDERPQLRHRL